MNVVFIFARSGSKGLKNKNIKMFNGKPLIYWTIKQAKKLKNVSDLLPMVYVEAQMFPRATQLYPEVIKSYPTFALFENGYFKATVNFQTIWFDIEKIVKNEYI